MKTLIFMVYPSSINKNNTYMTRHSNPFKCMRKNKKCAPIPNVMKKFRLMVLSGKFCQQTTTAQFHYKCTLPSIGSIFTLFLS